jgi:hypothetical protein
MPGMKLGGDAGQSLGEERDFYNPGQSRLTPVSQFLQIQDFFSSRGRPWAIIRLTPGFIAALTKTRKPLGP